MSVLSKEVADILNKAVGQTLAAESGDNAPRRLLDMPLLDMPLPFDGDIITLREYLQLLLLRMWDKDQEFNGKRPFGDGNWRMIVYRAMIKYGFVEGTIDKDGDIEGVDGVAADRLIEMAIWELN